MGVEKLQSFLESKCLEANVPVDLGELAGAAANSDAAAAAAAAVPKQLQLVVDAESCLDRLYGGRNVDWVAGGQWNRMLEFLTALKGACAIYKIKLVVFMNGALEKQRLPEWARDQSLSRRRIQACMGEVQQKRGVPPGRLWVPPAGLRQCLRLALRHVGIPTIFSREDHHHEIMAHCRENKFDGVLADHADFALFDPPRFFSASRIKLSFKQKLSTVEFLVDGMAKTLDLHPERLIVLGALLGNHMLTEQDLAGFHERVVRKRAAIVEAEVEGRDPAKAEEMAKSALVEAVADFLREVPSVEDLDALASLVFPGDENLDALSVKLHASVGFYRRGTMNGAPKAQRKKALKAAAKDITAASASVDALPTVSKFAPFASDSEEERLYLLGETLSPSTSVSQLMLLRHTRGLISPVVGQILTHREVKLEVVMEDVTKENTPSAMDLYRELRQSVYGLLLDVRGREETEDVIVKEWYVTKGNDAERPDLVPALPLPCEAPSLERLWFGVEAEDAQNRLKAFLSCMRSDDSAFLDPDKVPRQYVLLCSVLRYMLEFGKSKKKPYLSAPEVEAFLATAVCPLVKNAEMTKEIRLRKVFTRGLTLGALLMTGVNFACLANDACGSPIPWQLTCPWEYFDGKIFHLKLIKACSGSPLLEVCDNRADYVTLVEKMRDAILGDRDFLFVEPKLGKPAKPARFSPVATASKKPVARTATLTPPPFPGGGGGVVVNAQAANVDADTYASAYADAYVRFCASKCAAKATSAVRQPETDAYAAGYAAALMSAAQSGPQSKNVNNSTASSTRPRLPRSARVATPPRWGNNYHQESTQERILRQAADYANYHCFKTTPSGRVRRPPRVSTFRRPGFGPSSEDGGLGGALGGVDFRDSLRGGF